ncbi:MAG: hypothetical protein V3V20_04170 [Algisphaera sp.]
MPSFLEKIVGPRIPAEERSRHRLRYLIPALPLLIAIVLIAISLFIPYWNLRLNAPQYPDGLTITSYINHLTGDVNEIDGLNHYIGMRPLDEAAQFEKSIAIAAMIGMMICLAVAIFIRSRWAILLALPTIAFPFVFLADLYYWMNKFGQNLDPTAPLSGAIKPFTPPILGRGLVGQFETIAWAGEGLILAFVASFLLMFWVLLRHWAYKPLRQLAKANRQATAAVSHA